MTCPHGDAGDTNRRRRRTSLGYRTFACRACRRVFKEQSGTPLNDRHYPTDVVRLAGRWCSRDRAIDREGDLLDSRRSEHRDKDAARRFLRHLVDVAERTPQRITTDQHLPYRRAIRWILGRKVRHRCRQDWNHRTEHSHRAVQQRSDPCWASEDSSPPPASVQRSMSAGTPSASVNDGVRRSRWPSSDGSSSHAGGH